MRLRGVKQLALSHIIWFCVVEFGPEPSLRIKDQVPNHKEMR